MTFWRKKKTEVVCTLILLFAIIFYSADVTLCHASFFSECHLVLIVVPALLMQSNIMHIIWSLPLAPWMCELWASCYMFSWRSTCATCMRQLWLICVVHLSKYVHVKRVTCFVLFSSQYPKDEWRMTLWLPRVPCRWWFPVGGVAGWRARPVTATPAIGAFVGGTSCRTTRRITTRWRAARATTTCSSRRRGTCGRLPRVCSWTSLRSTLTLRSRADWVWKTSTLWFQTWRES